MFWVLFLVFLVFLVSCDCYFDIVVHFAFPWILQITFAGESLTTSHVVPTHWTHIPLVNKVISYFRCFLSVSQVYPNKFDKSPAWPVLWQRHFPVYLSFAFYFVLRIYKFTCRPFWAKYCTIETNITNSKMTSFFRFVNKRAIYRLGIISLAHAPVHTDFPVVNVHVAPLVSSNSLYNTDKNNVWSRITNECSSQMTMNLLLFT